MEIRKFIYLCILLLICKVGFTQDAYVTFSVSVKNGSNFDGPIGYGITSADLVWELSKLSGTQCTLTAETVNPAAVRWGGTSLISFRINFNVFNACDGWKVGDQMELKMTVNKPGNSLDGAIGICKFNAPNGGALMHGDGVVLEASSVNIGLDLPSLTFCQGATSGNEVTATTSDGSAVTWTLADGSALPAGFSVSGNKLTVGATVVAGSYSVVAKAGAATSDVVPITVKPSPAKVPEIVLPTDPVCLGEQVILKVSDATKENGVDYEWSNNAGSNTDMALYTVNSKTATYSVTPVKDGCYGTPSVAKTLTFKPDLSASTPTYTCDITTYKAKVTMSGGSGRPDDFEVYSDLACTTVYPGIVQLESTNQLVFSGLQSGVTTDIYVKSPYACGVVKLSFMYTCACSPTLALSGGGAFCDGDAPKTVGVAIDVKEPNRFKKWEFKLKGPDGSYIYNIADEKSQTTWSHTPTMSGAYTIEGFKVYNTDKSESCEGTVTGSPVTVKINSKPTVTLVATPDGVCAGSELKLEAVAVNGDGNYTYTWNGTGAAGKNTAVVNTKVVAGSTDYTVKVTDGNNCSSEVSSKETVEGYEVVVNTVTATPSQVNYNSSATLGCTVTLSPKVAGHTVAGYTWTHDAPDFTKTDKINGDNTLENPTTVNLVAATTYQVRVTDNYGCSATNTVNVTVKGGALSVIAKGAEGCEGSTLTLGCTPSGGATTNYSYEWTGDNGLTFVNNKVKEPVVAPGTLFGTYRAKVTVREGNNEETSNWVNVVVWQVPEISGLTSDAANNTCIPGSEVHISLGYASGGAILAWSSDPSGMIESETADKMQITTKKFPTTNRKYKYTVRATNGDGGCPVDSSIYISVQGSSLNIDFKNEVQLCQGEEQDLFPLVQVSGGVGTLANYTYTWTVSDPKLKLSATLGTNVKILAASEPGSYTIDVMVTDEKGNTATKALSVTITEKPVLSNINASKTLAYVGDEVTLYVDVKPKVTPEWSGGPLTTSTGVSVTTGILTTDGSYTYTVNAKNGDCAADPLTINLKVNTKDAPIEIMMDDVEGCSGSVISMTGSASGGSSNNYNYTWESLSPGLTLPTKFGATNSIPANTLPGTYQIKVTASDGTNFNSKVLNVTVKETPEITDAYATLAGKTDHITGAEMGDIVDLTVEMRDPVDVTYKWSSTTGPLLSSNMATVSTGAITTAGQLVYKVEASRNGCSATESVILNVTRPSVEGLLTMKVDKLCANSGQQLTITMEASGGDTYSFVLRDKFNNPVKTIDGEGGPTWEHKVSASGEGVYKLTDFKALKNGVVISSKISPTELTASFFPTPNVNAYKDAVMTHCSGDVLVLKATGDAGLTYTWDNGVQDGVGFVPTASTTYTVTAVDANNCQNTSSVAVTLADKPNIVVPEDVEICHGSEVKLEATGNADTYTWNNGIKNNEPFRPSKTANYVVEGKFLSTGCISRDTVSVIVNQPPHIIGASKHERNIAIGKNVSMGVSVVGKVTGYQWQWKENGSWSDLSDMSGVPVISGTNTDTLRLANVPREWDGTELKCVVSGECGTTDTTFILHVKECFDLAAELYMGEGILQDTDPTDQIDGWYCIGTPITLNAKLFGLEEEVDIENPVFKWKTDGRDFHDEHDKNINTNTANLTWIPQRWEDDVNVQVCVYSDGACDTVCSRSLRLKARQPDVVDMKIVTSIDPERMFCPGDTVDVTVAMKNEGKDSDVHWYRDIFDKGNGLRKQFVMDQKDTWLRAVLLPSPELCIEKAVMDSVFLRVKDFVQPTLQIDNNIHDTVACIGDTLLFSAIWSNAGNDPRFYWQQDLWSRGYEPTAVIGVSDKDTWIKCTLVPGKDVCYEGNAIADSMLVRVREAGTLTISVDMTDKRQGDELVFVSEVENMIGNWDYSWYVNGNLNPCEEKDLIIYTLRQNDVVQCAIGGNEVCLNKIFSNEIVVDFGAGVSRDTMITIYTGENIRELNMLKPCDDITKVIFRIDIPAMYGMATITPDGKFNYLPNRGFIGTDYVKYVILDRTGKNQIAEGYIYITVKDSERFMVPNLITPNGDGLNDTWKLDFLVDYPDHRITVYDRNGKPVFESTNYQNDWDGSGFTKGGYVGHINLVNGVYTYVIELGDKDKTVLKSWVEIRANMNRRNYR